MKDRQKERGFLSVIAMTIVFLMVGIIMIASGFAGLRSGTEPGLDRQALNHVLEHRPGEISSITVFDGSNRVLVDSKALGPRIVEHGNPLNLIQRAREKGVSFYIREPASHPAFSERDTQQRQIGIGVVLV